MKKTHYSCSELAEMKLPGYPTTKEGWYQVVERERWGVVEHKSRGRGGIRREYAPSPAIMKLIAAFPAMEARGTGSDVTLTVTVSIEEAVYISRWLEKRERKA